MPARALDIIGVVNTVEAYTDLTTRQGWTAVEWKQWLTNLALYATVGGRLRFGRLLAAADSARFSPRQVRRVTFFET